jgi:hypothetical protein
MRSLRSKRRNSVYIFQVVVQKIATWNKTLSATVNIFEDIVIDVAQFMYIFLDQLHARP